MGDFPGGKIKIARRLDGAVRIEFNQEIIVVTPEFALKVARALIQATGAEVQWKNGVSRMSLPPRGV